MSPRKFATLAAAGLVTLLPCSVTLAQPEAKLAQRVAELEKRVARLEARLGQTKAAEPPARPAPTVSSSASTPAYATRIPLELKLVTKKVVKGTGGQGDDLQFFVQFKNKGSKEIVGIEGDLIVKNINAQKLLQVGMSASKYIAINDSVIWIGAVEYDPKETSHKSIVATDKSYLVVELSPQSIMYQDGTKDVYRKPEE